MENNQMKLTQENLDKVRNIEGFPIGKDEDIIALSRPPYYTACPNPFIKEFIEKNGTPYDEETDDYHCEPFAADVSEGKGDMIYNAHSYHTKVPYKAIMRYILHYTKPNDIVFDGFCGTGMTGVASQLCGSNDDSLRNYMMSGNENCQWGKRNAILSDLSPTATFVSYNYNFPVDDKEHFSRICDSIFARCDEKYGWMFKTRIVNNNGLFEGEEYGDINYIIWSDAFICPSCGHEYIYWNVAVDEENKIIKDVINCPYCRCALSKKNSERSYVKIYDKKLDEILPVAKQVPVIINYTYQGNRYDKKPDEFDLEIINKINDLKIDTWYPTNRMCDGREARRNDSAGIMYVHQFYTKRNLAVISFIYNEAKKLQKDEKFALLSAIRASMSYGTKMVKVNIGRLLSGGGTFSFGAVTGTLYMPSISAERSILDAIKNKCLSITKIFNIYPNSHDVRIGTGSLTNIENIPDDSVDYIFTDPPFGDNLNYAELNYLWESWETILTNDDSEAIMDKYKDKDICIYQKLMMEAFSEYYRVLKPNRWITVEFHNTKNIVWNAIQEALLSAGFIVADVRTLDKKQGSFKQVQNNSSAKQDLIISAYKPKKSFVLKFGANVGNPQLVWEFVRQHLANVPVAPDANCNGKLDIVLERLDYLLFDRMVAYHVINGMPVPMDAHNFYDGLRQRFVERDGMFFNPDQVNEYDEKRLTMEVEDQQMALFVTDEKNAIAWLHQLLNKTQLSYQEIQPKYLQELHQDKREEIPELLDMLKENFVQDDAGKWYIPDLTDAADLAKLRRKKLLKEFYDSYAAGKQKIKVARQEAIRAGFDDCWAKKDYATIVHVGDRLPEAILQEDQALLMYYDNASSRV